MFGDRTIAIVGASDDDVARLCLQMRRAAARLDNRWRWGIETRADLIIADPLTSAGVMARVRARACGMRCAVLCDSDVDAEGDFALVRPVQVETLIDVLSEVAEMAQPPADVMPQRYDFYLRDFGDSVAANDADATASAELDHKQATVAHPVIGLDEYLREDVRTAAWIDAPRAPAEVPATASLELAASQGRDHHAALVDSPPLRHPVLAETLPAASRPRRPSFGKAIARRVVAVFQARELSKPATDPSAWRLEPEQLAARAPVAAAVARVDATKHTLWAYLTGNLLVEPAVIELPDAPPLTLDPANRVFHARGELRELEPYCDTLLRRADWRSLSPIDLARTRKTHPAQSFHKLLWMDVLVHGNGKLAPHLDPDGTYRLLRWLDLDLSYPQQYRIATTLLSPRQLDEIVAECDVPMPTVCDTVEAFDAIGYVQWRSRPQQIRLAQPSQLTTLIARTRKLMDRYGDDWFGLMAASGGAA